MKKYEKVRSTVKPQNTIIDKYSVYLNENIKEIEVEDRINKTEFETHVEYEYDMLQYDKDEFILMQSQQIIDTQLALCEIYEGTEV